MSTDVRTRPSTLRWWRELLYAAGFYAVYSLVRNLQGSASGSEASSHATRVAFKNARAIIHVERFLHIFHEQAIQHFFIHAKVLLQFLNFYYGSAHFLVTIGALIWLFRRDPERYPLWRNTIAVMTALALIGFALYPLMPPRLLDPIMNPHPRYGFIDTLDIYGGSWSFNSDAMERVSNQYAAMPSLHFGWALWCAFVLFPVCRRRWTRVLAAAYPLVTLFAVVVTANHFVIDAVGGAVVFGLGYLIGRQLTRRRGRGWSAGAGDAARAGSRQRE